MDRNTIFAYILILVVLFAIPFYFNWISPPPQQQPDTVRVTQQDTLTRDTTKAPEDEPSVQEEAEKPAEIFTEEDTSAQTEGEEAPPQLGEEYVIETEKFWVSLTNRGGGTINSLRLKGYSGRGNNPYVQLIPERSKQLLNFSATGFEGESFDFRDRNFSLETSSGVTPEPSDTVRIYDKSMTLVFSHTTEEGATLVRSLTFYPSQYHIGLNLRLEHFRDLIANREYQLSWNSAIAITEENVSDDLNYSKAYGLLGDEMVDIDGGKADKGDPEVESMEGNTKWVAVRNKYFTSIIAPVSRQGTGMTLRGTKEFGGNPEVKKYDVSLTLPYEEQRVQSDSFLVYIGPLDYGILNDYERGFQRMMNFGWSPIRPISKLVLWAFTTIHQVIPNYGLVLILFGVVVKILVFPLTKKSYVSMKEMQNLQPRVQELREKYKDDSEKMNQEMMKIYKEHGVNPIGGCLPMLLQMPLLYALFIVFRSTIELRGAEFIGWITDLSQPDTVLTLPFSIPLYGANVNILPLIMAVTMIGQQRMTSTGTTGSQQKMMMWFMPVFFLLIFNNFPSGLNLYYALFNIMTIIQQKWFIDLPEAPADNKS